MPTEIKEEVRNILENIPDNSGWPGRSYVTAYQILERLSPATRDRLISERGKPGLHSGNYYAAASVVSDAAEMIPGIEIAFLETSFISVTLKDGTDITPGNKNVGLYRMR